MKKAIFIGVLLSVLGFSTLTNAALQNNGNGLIYDTDRNITWYDVNPITTGGYEGLKTWDDTVTWVANLTVGNTTAGSWRLPSALNQDGSAPNSGYNITGSELGHLFYTELGNRGYYDVNGNPQSGSGLINTFPFTYLQADRYWSGTELLPQGVYVWWMTFWNISDQCGRQSWVSKDSYAFTLAVHPGNVGAPVPIPGAMFLFAPGLAGLALLRRRLKKQ